MSNSSLNKAARAKNDEFYTRLWDVSAEIKHYRKHFENKIVYCNCDDPKQSAFFHFFSHQFEILNLQCVVATCYKSMNPDLFSNHDSESSVALKYRGDQNGNNRPDAEEIFTESLEGDGDFRSQESIEILKLSDIVVTNPPFSLFREYVAQLVKYDKKFLIIGSIGAVSYKEIFPLIRDNKMWLGPSISSGDREFGVPEHYPLNAAKCGFDSNGNKFIRVKGVRWFTNLPHKKRNEELILTRYYSPEEYPKYDNYDAIEVSQTKIIPKDYAGVMGVPVTFLDKYNPDQFEILGISEQCGRGNSGGLWDTKSEVPHPLISGEKKYVRIFIRNKKPE